MYRFEGELWLYQGLDPWHFVALPDDVSDEIRRESVKRPFGTVRVDVVIGDSRWSTSLFPDKATQAYLLPVKRSVLDAEGLAEGVMTTVELTLGNRP